MFVLDSLGFAVLKVHRVFHRINGIMRKREAIEPVVIKGMTVVQKTALRILCQHDEIEIADY